MQEEETQQIFRSQNRDIKKENYNEKIQTKSSYFCQYAVDFCIRFFALSCMSIKNIEHTSGAGLGKSVFAS